MKALKNYKPLPNIILISCCVTVLPCLGVPEFGVTLPLMLCIPVGVADNIRC